MTSTQIVALWYLPFNINNWYLHLIHEYKVSNCWAFHVVKFYEYLLLLFSHDFSSKFVCYVLGTKFSRVMINIFVLDFKTHLMIIDSQLNCTYFDEPSEFQFLFCFNKKEKNASIRLRKILKLVFLCAANIVEILQFSVLFTGFQLLFYVENRPGGFVGRVLLETTRD